MKLYSNIIYIPRQGVIIKYSNLMIVYFCIYSVWIETSNRFPFETILCVSRVYLIANNNSVQNNSNCKIYIVRIEKNLSKL